MKFPIGAKVTYTPKRGKVRDGEVVGVSDVGFRKVLLSEDPFPVRIPVEQLEDSCASSRSDVESSETHHDHPGQGKENPVSTKQTTSDRPSAAQLTEDARNLGIPGWEGMKRSELEAAVTKAKNKTKTKGDKGKAKAKSEKPAKEKTAKPAAPAKKAPAKKAAAKKAPVAKKPAAKKSAAPAKKTAAPKKAAAKKAPATKKAAPKKTASKAKSAPAPKRKVKPGENPYRKGSAIYTIHQLLVKGGKRRTLAEKLKAAIGDLHPYSPDRQTTLQDYDKRLLLGAQEGKKYGFVEVRKGRGLDGTIRIEHKSAKKK